LKTVLLDTDVISFAIKGDTRYEWYREQLQDCETCLSFMTLAELYYWVEYRQWGTRRKQRLASHVRRCTLLKADEHLCRRWAEVTAKCRRAGRPIDTADAWIAATAIEFSLPLYTNNARHFESIEGLTVVTASTDD
jgi:predicted nucleic acid-binding protein